LFILGIFEPSFLSEKDFYEAILLTLKCLKVLKNTLIVIIKPFTILPLPNSGAG